MAKLSYQKTSTHSMFDLEHRVFCSGSATYQLYLKLLLKLKP